MVRRDIWSSTMIDVANYCMMRYYLIYVEREKRMNFSSYEKGSLLHKMIEDFWIEKNGFKIPKYDSAKEFASKAQGKWVQRIIGAEKSGRVIDWRFENEKWLIRSSLPGICIPLYEWLVREGPPLYSELPFEFSFLEGDNRRIFKGRIDEVRIRDGKVILRDYKSGNPLIGEMKVKHDPQMTLYSVGLCSLCKADPNFAKSLGLEAEANKFMGNPIFISEKIHPEFFMVEALRYSNQKIPQQVIYPTFRTDEHFFELIRMIDGVTEKINKELIYPERGRKCDYCDVKIACEKKLSLASNNEAKDSNRQLVFDFAAPFSQQRNKIYKHKEVQRKFRLRKKDNSLTLG